MSFIINQGFSLKSPQFNFERDYFKDVASLKAAAESDFPDYFITNVAGVLYQLRKSNSVDATTGKWRRLATTSGNGVTVDSALSSTSTNPVQNKVINSALAGKASTAVATKTANGLLSAADKIKLDGIAEGANKIYVDTSLSSTSTNTVQNKVINAAIEGVKGGITSLNASIDIINDSLDEMDANIAAKADKTVASPSTNGLLSAADKKKLDGIATGGTADSAISNDYIDSLFTTAASADTQSAGDGSGEMTV